MRELASRGHQSTHATASSHVETYTPPARTPAEQAHDAATAAVREVGAIDRAIDALHAAYEANDPARWHDARGALERQLAHAGKALARARTHAQATSSQVREQLAAAEHELADNQAVAGSLRDPPRGWADVSRETEIIAVVTAPIEGSASAGFASKENAIKAELARLSPAESRALAERVRKARPGDPIAEAIGRMIPARKRRILAVLDDARRRQAQQHARESRTRARSGANEAAGPADGAVPAVAAPTLRDRVPSQQRPAAVDHRHDQASAPASSNFQIAKGGTTATIHRAWLLAHPVEHWTEVVTAMHAAGAVPWAKPEGLARFARMLGTKYPLHDELVTFHLDAIAVAIIGLPPDAAPVLERVGNDILIALPGVDSSGNNEQIPLDGRVHADRFDAVYRALASFTGLPVRERIELGAVGVSSTTGAMRLHDAELARIFGADAWRTWKQPGRQPKRNGSSTGSRGSTPAHGARALEHHGVHHDLSAAEEARVAKWFATHGSTAHRFWSRDVLAMLDELDRDPILAGEVEAFLARGSRDQEERALDEFALRDAIERARLERERARLGLGAFREGAAEARA